MPADFEAAYDELTQIIHKKLVEILYEARAALCDLSSETIRLEIRLVIERMVDFENPPLNRMERERLIEDVLAITMDRWPTPG